MTELIRNWLMGVTCAAMVMAVAEAIIPEGHNIRRICRLAGGLILLLAAVSPVLELDETGLTDVMNQYSAATTEWEREVTEQNNSLYRSIIEERAAAYILDKAKELGITCQAEVVFAYDEAGIPYPKEATISGNWTEEQRKRLYAVLETELGLRPDGIYFERSRS